MRLATFLDEEGRMRLGVVREDMIADVSRADPDIPATMLTLIEAGPEALAAASRAAEVAFARGHTYAVARTTLMAPIPRPPEFLGVGLNFHDHAAEAGLEAPREPLIFNKQTSCVNAPSGTISRPADSTLLDYEGELGIVIGRASRTMTREAAQHAIFGYVVVNDVSVRDWQLKSPTHTLGKSFDGHGPFGPWIVTADELSDVSALRIETRVNGLTRQSCALDDMIFDCAAIVQYLSRVMTLPPGVVIATGTPAGVGHCAKPPCYLEVGDCVEVEIEGLGKLSHRIVEPTAAS